MGFMDKAKQLAEQAQQKLDETQKQFNEKQAAKAGGEAADVRYDEHGRPVEAQAAPEQSTVHRPQTTEPPAEPAAEEPAAEESGPPKRPSEGVDDNPDPFKPIQ
jgi:hypothetical protein